MQFAHKLQERFDLNNALKTELDIVYSDDDDDNQNLLLDDDTFEIRSFAEKPYEITIGELTIQQNCALEGKQLLDQKLYHTGLSEIELNRFRYIEEFIQSLQYKIKHLQVNFYIFFVCVILLILSLVW